jgi:GxxExxY protein
MSEDFPLKEETYRILGACFEVYNEMGRGFLEPVYQECLELELQHQEIPFESQVTLELEYKGHKLEKRYQPDLICFESVVVEIKAASSLAIDHEAQLLNYMNAGNFEVGLLVNFGHYPKLEYTRLVNQQKNYLRQSASSAGKMR